MQLSRHEWENLLQGVFQGEVKYGIPMKDLTSLSLGGPADLFVTPAEPLSLRNIIAMLDKENIPFVVLGAGTNILVRDGGIEGAVISTKAFKRIEVLKEDNGEVEIFVEAGVPWQKLVNYCKDKGYSGIEGLTGIPGTVGGAICGNAGANGYETKDVLTSVAIMNEQGKLDRFKAEGLGFDYRSSDITTNDVVLSANLKLKKDDKETVSRKTEDFFRKKKERQPLSAKSAGCVFKNTGGASAGKLIDEAGCKGMKIGDIEVSTLHANFFINRGKGTASEFIRLMDEVAGIVQKKFGMSLEPEIKVIGRR